MPLQMLWQSPSGLIHREAHAFEMRTKCGCSIGNVGSGWRPIGGYFIPDMRCYRCYPEAASGDANSLVEWDRIIRKNARN